MQAQGARLEVEDVERQRVALLGEAAERERALLRRPRTIGELVVGVASSAPRPAGRAGRRGSCRPRRSPTSGRSRRDTARRRAGAAAPACGRLHARKRVAVERQAVRVDEGAAQARAWREHERPSRWLLPRARCASATPPMLPSLPTTSGIGRPARSASACSRRCGRRSRRSSPAGSATCRTRRSAGTARGSPARRRRPGSQARPLLLEVVVDGVDPASDGRYGPCLAVGRRCRSLVETAVPSSHTAPTFEVVAPPSVPMKT